MRFLISGISCRKCWFTAHLSRVMTLMKIIVAISRRGPGHFLPIDDILSIVPFTAVHLITEVILDFNLEAEQSL